MGSERQEEEIVRVRKAWGGVQVRQSNLIGFHPSCSVLQVTKLDEGEAPALTWRQHSDTDAVG